MKYFIEGLEPVMGRHCYYSGVSNILNYQGISVSEAEAFVLFGGFDIRYDDDTGALDLTVKNILPISNFSGISMDITYTGPKEKKQHMKEILSAISKGSIVIIAVKNRYLNYNPVYQESEDYLHFILMNGFDEETGLAYVIDTFLLDHSGNSSMYTGKMPLSNIEAGLGAFGYLKNKTIEFLDRSVIFRQFYLEFGKFLYGNPGQNRTGIYEGIAGIKKYNDSLFKGTEEKPELFEKKCYDVIYHLKFGIILHLLDYMKEMVEDYRSEFPSYARFSDDLNTLKGQWHNYFIMLLKMAFAKDNKKVKNNAYNYSQKLFGFQNNLFTDIYQEMRKS